MNIRAKFATLTSSVVFVAGLGVPAAAQAPLGILARASAAAAALPPEPPTPPATASSTATSDDTTVTVYPILLWMPSFSATSTVPPFPDTPGGPDGPGGSGSTKSSSLDGAALAGISIAKANWRIDADGIWAGLTSTRDRPLLNVDLDVVYGHVSGGVKVYKDLYVTGGVRRVALKYDIQLADRPQHFQRSPGIWDPLVGLGWHPRLGSRWTLHVVGEGGGFGVGADTDLSGSIRADVDIAAHIGLTFGYTALYLKFSDTVLQRTFEVDQTLQGPVIGLGLYF